MEVLLSDTVTWPASDDNNNHDSKTVQRWTTTDKLINFELIDFSFNK